MKFATWIVCIWLVCVYECRYVATLDGSSFLANLGKDNVQSMNPEEDEDTYKRSIHQSPKVAFMAYSNKNYNEIRNYYTVVFENVHVNLGNRYNIHNGHFTAPTKGVYLFMAKLASEHKWNKGYRVLAELVRNSRRITTFSSGHEGVDSASTTDVMVLNKGDQVWVRLIPVTRLFNLQSNYHSFGGVLMYPI